MASSPGAIYFGAFGGGGGMSSTSLNQQGTAYLIEAEGGPLAVDATGNSDSSSVWLVGANVGYAWSSVSLGSEGSAWNFVPAAEMEGYYLGGNTITGSNIINSTKRLASHVFSLSYPSNIGVFLVDAIFNLNNSHFGKFHPYIGVGAGTAAVSISGAVSTQTSPSEAGVNHFNSDPNDTTTAFAVQPKVGIRFALTKKLSLLAEYRYLYIAATNYNFGSTVYASHPETSGWVAKIGGQSYNMGTIGLQYAI